MFLEKFCEKKSIIESLYQEQRKTQLIIQDNDKNKEEILYLIEYNQKYDDVVDDDYIDIPICFIWKVREREREREKEKANFFVPKKRWQ